MQAGDEAERAALARTRRFQRRSAFALAGVGVLVAAGLVVGILQSRNTQRREATVLASLAHRAIEDQQYERALRIAVQGLPVRGDVPWALGWSAAEIRAVEGKLAGAAQLSQIKLKLKAIKAR